MVEGAWRHGDGVGLRSDAVTLAPATDESDSGARGGQPSQLGREHQVLLHGADALALTVGLTLGAAALQAWSPVRAGSIRAEQALVVALATWVAFHLHGLYRRPASRLRPSAWWRPRAVARSLPTAVLLALGGSALLLPGPRMTLTAAVAMAAPASVLVPLTRRLVVGVLTPATVTRIMIVGSGQVADRVTSRLRRCRDTYVVGQVDDHPPRPGAALGDLSDLPRLCREHRVDRIIVAFSQTREPETMDRLRQVEQSVPVSVVPRLFEVHSWRSAVEELHGIPLMHVAPAQLQPSARRAKRVFDVAVAGVAFALLLLPGLVTAALIKLDSPGPVFFRQLRIGRHERPFSILEFRTMTMGAESHRDSMASANDVDGPLFKIHNDPRVTRVGALLRRTSLDEMPQLLNVLRGEMSLVGPRPLPGLRVATPRRSRARAVRRRARDDRAVAGVRPQRPELRRSPAPRLGVRAVLVVPLGPAHHS